MLRSCEDESKDLRTIFGKVIPPDNAPWSVRYGMAARAVKPGKTRKVETLNADILKNLQLLGEYHLLRMWLHPENFRVHCRKCLALGKTTLHYLMILCDNILDGAMLEFQHWGRNAEESADVWDRNYVEC